VLKLLGDNDWAVRRQLAATLGELPAGSKEAAIAALLERNGNDPIAMDAAISGIRGSELAVLERLLQTTAETPQRNAAITMLAATIVRGGEDAASQAVLQRVAEEARPAWQRSALLRGAEVALLAAAMPGNPASAAIDPNAPCATCPGGRGESRGRNYAEMQAAAARPAPAPAPTPPADRGGPRLKLNQEPALVTVAARGGDLGTRATKVLDRIEWPGKPGAAAAAIPLTSAEQKRFAAGQEIYKNLCEACHGADGREQQVAATLAGSSAVVGVAGIPIRVLLNGKDGSIGEMPAHGETLSDEEIASVLTYIRRSWGNAGAPIDSAAVTDIRSATAGRAKPWTQPELSAITR
jgi:mono/diheme cytochrome c family protein